jgi:outer membrane protein TolC
LGLFGRRRGDEAVAAADIAQAEADGDAARVSVVAEVARSYIDLRAAQARAAAEQARYAAAQAALARARRLRALGLADTGDVDKADAAAREAGSRLELAAAAPTAQAWVLAQLLGRTDIDPQWLQPAPLPSLPAPAPLPAPAQLLRTRPEIRRAEADVARAAGELGIARAELWPQLNLGGSLTYASKLDGDELLRPTSILSVGPMISMPLFDWGMRRATATAHGHLLAAATVRYRAAVVEAARDVQSALAALAAARARYAELDARVGGAPQRLSRVERLQALGLADAAARADAARAEADLAAERSDAQSAALQDLVALYKALGGAPPPLAAAPPA